LTRTIAISENTYRKLKQLKDALNMGYSDLINMLIETYEKYRVEELKKLCSKLRVDEKEFNKIKEITEELRRRKWW